MAFECFRRVDSGGECGAPRGRGAGIHGIRGSSGGIPARGPGFSPDLCPRARPSPPVFTLRKHSTVLPRTATARWAVEEEARGEAGRGASGAPRAVPARRCLRGQVLCPTRTGEIGGIERGAVRHGPCLPLRAAEPTRLVFSFSSTYPSSSSQASPLCLSWSTPASPASGASRVPSKQVMFPPTRPSCRSPRPRPP